MRKIIAALLDRRARYKLLRLPHVSIAPSAKVSARRIVTYQACKLQIGEGTIVEGSLVSERDGTEICIGRNTFIGNSLIACASRIEIGDDVLISWGCNIVDHNSHSLLWEQRSRDVRDWYQGRSTKDWSNVPMSAVRIHNKSWIGLNTIVLRGVEIGEGAVVGAGSVVTKSVEPWTVVAGNPARYVRSIEETESRRFHPSASSV